MKCSNIAIGLLIFLACLSPVFGQSVGTLTDSRRCERVESQYGPELNYDMRSGETALFMWYNGAGKLTPWHGLVFPEHAWERELRLSVRIRKVDEGNRFVRKVDEDNTFAGVNGVRWMLHVGTSDPGSSSTGGRGEDVKEGELPLPVRSIPLPFLNVGEAAKVEMFMIPYRVAGERVESLVCAIASDIETLRTALQGVLAQNVSFSWEKSFFVASTPLTPPDKEKWLRYQDRFSTADLTVMPGDLPLLESITRPRSPTITVKSRTGIPVAVTAVEVPDTSIGVNIVVLPSGDTRVVLSNLRPIPGLDGKAVILHTDNPGTPEVRIPIRILPDATNEPGED